MVLNVLISRISSTLPPFLDRAQRLNITCLEEQKYVQANHAYLLKRLEAIFVVSLESFERDLANCAAHVTAAGVGIFIKCTL